MNDGWIKLHRKLLDNPIFFKDGLLQLFIYCLLKANHEPNKIIFNGSEIIIEVGQFITGREVMAKDLKQNESTIYKRLKILEKLSICNIKSNNKFSLVTIVNYRLYQLDNIKSNSKSNNKVTTKEQQSNTNKNDKNDKNDKKSNKTAIEIAIDDFKEFRKKIKKPMTDRAVELIIEKLNKLAADDETKIAILNQSIENSWQGVFPLKEDKQQGKPKPASFDDIE